MNAPTAHRVSRDPARSFGLPGPYYWDPAIFRREQERIFGRSWWFAGLVGGLAEPGAELVARADEGPIVVTRDGAGLRARHAADGRAAAVEDMGGMILVHPDPAAVLAPTIPGLAAELRRWTPDIDRLAFAARITSEFQANWKVMVDNSIECYHCPVAHPDFQSLLDLDSYRIEVHERHAVHRGRAGRADNSAYAYDGDGAYGFAAFWLFPSLLFGPFPGRCNLTVHQILPLGPERTREHFDFYFLDATPNDEEAAAVAFFRDVLRPQDVALVESVQRGLHSLGYRDGPLMFDPAGSATSESNLHRFHRLVVEAVAA